MTRQFLLVMLCGVLCACGAAKPIPLFPQLDPHQRVWQDSAGHWYSAVQDRDGKFVVHDPATGYFYSYWRDAEVLQRRPDFAPDLEYRDGHLNWGERQLSPAPVSVEEVYVRSDGVDLHAVLILPVGAGPWPVVISGQGSEKLAALDWDWSPSWYLQAGYGTLIYDKRGTGSSGGEFTHSFDQLARDMGQLITWLSQHPQVDARLIGIAGNSQSVRIATLEAHRNPAVAFIIASYGTTSSPVEEEIQFTRLRFTQAYPDEDWESFRPFVAACIAAFAQAQDERWDDVLRYKAQWASRIEAERLAQTQVGDGCLAWQPWLLRWFGRRQLPPGLDWGYAPEADIAALHIPVLWAFAADDSVAPSADSIAQVERWIAQGKKNFTLKVYPGTDHGISLRSVDRLGQSYRRKQPQYINDVIAWLRQLRAASRTAG